MSNCTNTLKSCTINSELDYDPYACRDFIVAEIQLAVRDYTYGEPQIHRQAALFLQSHRARQNIEALGIDVNDAFQSLNQNRRQFVSFIIRAQNGDETAVADYREWWREHFLHRPKNL